MLHRTNDLGRASLDEAARTASISFSSEAPVERYFGNEILDHSPQSVRLGRLNGGGAVLLEHDRNRQIGVIVTAVIGNDRKGRAVIRFSKNPLAEEVFQDVKDGIRRLVSVGYKIHKQETTNEPGGMESVRVTDWEPYELSLVSIPADETVGVGRAVSNPTPQTSKNNSTMSIQNQNLDTSAERNRASSITEMAIQAQRNGLQIDASRAIADGITPDAFREQIFNDMLSRQTPYSPGNAPAGGYHREGGSQGNGAEMNLRNYSLTRAIQQAGLGRLDGYEAEVSQEIARRTGKAPDGFFVPHNAFINQRAGMSVTGDAGIHGASNVGLEVRGFIDALRPMLAVAQAGATVMSGLSSNVGIPRQAAASTASWKSETAELDEQTPELEQLLLTPKRIGAWTKLSKQLIAQSSPDVEAFVRMDLLQAIAVGFDYAAIAGTGLNDQPTGILNTPGIGNVVGGTNGAAPTWANLTALVAAISNANALGTNPAFLFNTKVESKLRTTLKAPLTETLILSEGQDTLVGKPWLASNNVPSNLVKGTSGAVASAIIFGNFADVVLASFGMGVDVIVDPYTLATSGQTRIVINSLCDVGIRRAASFAAMKDALTA